jgi:hypothetical protein
MTGIVYDGTVKAAYERSMGPGDPPRPVKHAENPDQPGYALCGTRLRATPASSTGDRCAVCRDLARKTWVAR